MKRYTAVVVGGGAGGRLSLNALQASDRYDLRAVADISLAARETLAKDFPGVAVFDSHQEMFAKCPTDIVCVSTWAPSHKEVTEAALKLPLKGILVEKPLADTHAAGAEVLAMIKQRSLPMAVPHNLLVSTHAKEILQRVGAGDIGRLCLIEIECSEWDIINAGIHWLNYVCWLIGREPVDYVMAACDTSSRTYRDGIQVETMAVTYAQARSGVRIVMHTGDYVTTTREGKDVLFRLVGTEGLIEFWAWESAYFVVNAQAPEGKLVEVPRTGKGHQEQLENMARQIDEGRTDYAIAESSLAALELCEAAYLAGKHRCKVDLPLASFTPPPPNDWEPGKPYSGTGGGRDGRNLPKLG
ncbi:MAG: Gfo/Idh/MocA family oxidoreductase [Armatimonadetes bacterium]|nr:Gfo/Idh/MocA family oxidoreductase [Armatimonadota bacterium]